MKHAVSRLIATVAILVFSSLTLLSQSDARRTTVAITYPLDQTIEVAFHGTTRLPRLKGTAKVRRQGRRGTRVELNIDHLPRGYELGGVYTTFVLWAISPDGHVDNLGEIKRSGSGLIDSKIDVTTPLQTFALLVTAEPHFLVHAPSRMVVMENLAPEKIRDSQLKTAKIQYIGNSSDYFRDSRVPAIAETDFREFPVALLGARQAINLARYAGAERDAPNELRTAEADLQQAESAQRMHQPDREIDILARQAISSGAKAEDMALVRRTARERREELERRDAAVRSAERTVDSANQENSRLQRELNTERHARELAERDAVNATEQLRDARTEIARLREELRTVRADADDAKVRLARIEGEKQAEDARRSADKRAADLRAAAGVDVTRIQASGMGAANPIAPNTTLANRAKNRRTEITLALSGQ